jgi:hypothetical protein
MGVIAGSSAHSPVRHAVAARNRSSRSAHALARAPTHAKSEAREEDVADVSALLFDPALIFDSELPDDPAAFATRLNRLVLRGLPASIRLKVEVNTRELGYFCTVRALLGGAPAASRSILISQLRCDDALGKRLGLADQATGGSAKRIRRAAPMTAGYQRRCLQRKSRVSTGSSHF